LGKVPTLVTDDGTVLYDSRVICEYFNEIGGGQLVPAQGAARWYAVLPINDVSFHPQWSF
jgi:glutathione S-transferase